MKEDVLHEYENFNSIDGKVKRAIQKFLPIEEFELISLNNLNMKLFVTILFLLFFQHDYKSIFGSNYIDALNFCKKNKKLIGELGEQSKPMTVVLINTVIGYRVISYTLPILLKTCSILKTKQRRLK